jgi:catechol 2,3-dioxygenase-like lactoylglutathione lyase family enzyme
MGKVSTRDQETNHFGLRAELFVTDVARSAIFYREVLGFETLRENPSGYRSLAREGAVLGLNDIAQLPEGHPARPGPGEVVGRGVELVVVVEDVAALHARAAESGLAEVSDLVDQPWGLTDFRVLDPDGYYIRITSRSVGS